MRKVVVLILLLSPLGCGHVATQSAPTISDAGLGPDTSPFIDAPITTDYTLDFSSFPSGGVRVGNMFQLQFAINQQQPTTMYNLPSGYVLEGTIPPNAVTHQSLGSYCRPDGASSLNDQHSYGTPPPGNAAWVDHVDLKMSDLPALADGGDPRTGNDELCFGYRTAGTWTWDLTPRKADWTASDQTFRIRLPVARGGVDAIEIVFNYGDTMFMRSIVVGTLPTH